MKHAVIFVLTVSALVIGIAVADPGVPPVNEVQGLSTTTRVIAVGNFNAGSSVDLAISSGVPLTSIPGPGWTGEGNEGATIYHTVYTEDTQNSELGYISYEKDLDLSTADMGFGRYNIKTVKQITYLGVDASSVMTDDYLLVDGAGWPDSAADHLICPFAGEAAMYAAFCNRFETGSSMNLKVANLNTQLGNRVIMNSIDPGVAICYNNLGVASYDTNLPSEGSASAYIKGTVKEGGRLTDAPGLSEGYGPPGDLYGTVEFFDSTAISGEIYSFGKGMSYKSVIDTSGDSPTG